MPNIEYKLKIALISMFFNMLANERMLSFIAALNVPLYIYLILLRSFSQPDRPISNWFKYKETEKCMKFVYQYLKVTRESIPKAYIHLFKHFLETYHKNYDYGTNEPTYNKDRIKLCYSYIF